MLRNIIIVLGVIAGLSVVYYCVQEKTLFVHANPQIQISFNYEMKGEGAIRITGDYFSASTTTPNEKPVQSVGIRETIEGKEYWGDRMRKGDYADDILTSADYDCQYLTRYDEMDNSYEFIINTKIYTELIVEGAAEDRCIIFDMTHDREYKQNRKIFEPGSYNVTIYFNKKD